MNTKLTQWDFMKFDRITAAIVGITSLALSGISVGQALAANYTRSIPTRLRGSINQ